VRAAEVGDDEAAAGLEDAQNLGGSGALDGIVEVVEEERAEDDVEAGVVVGQRVGQALVEGDRRLAGLRAWALEDVRAAKRSAGL